MLETLELDGKSIIVTGGGRGLGRAMALAMAEAGAQIAIASRTEAQVFAVVDEINAAGGSAVGIPTDVTDSEQVNALVAQTVDGIGVEGHRLLFPIIARRGDLLGVGGQDLLLQVRAGRCPGQAAR